MAIMCRNECMYGCVERRRNQFLRRNYRRIRYAEDNLWKRVGKCDRCSPVEVIDLSSRSQAAARYRSHDGVTTLYEYTWAGIYTGKFCDTSGSIERPAR